MSAVRWAVMCLLTVAAAVASVAAALIPVYPYEVDTALANHRDPDTAFAIVWLGISRACRRWGC